MKIVENSCMLRPIHKKDKYVNIDSAVESIQILLDNINQIEQKTSYQ